VVATKFKEIISIYACDVFFTILIQFYNIKLSQIRLLFLSILKMFSAFIVNEIGFQAMHQVGNISLDVAAFFVKMQKFYEKFRKTLCYQLLPSMLKAE